MKLLETEKFYSETYCRRIDAKQWRHELTPQTMTVLYNFFEPKSVIDVGCANGLHLKAFKQLGVEKLFGIEGTPHWAPYIKKYFGENYLIADLRESIELKDKYDLVISFEVLEHLEEEKAEQAAKNLVSFGDVLCISANPTRGGFYHLNAKPKRYWVDIFELLGMTYCQDEVDQLQTVFQKGRCSGWFKTGLMVFRKTEN